MFCVPGHRARVKAGDYITRPVLMQMIIEGKRGDTARIRIE